MLFDVLTCDCSTWSYNYICLYLQIFPQPVFLCVAGVLRSDERDPCTQDEGLEPTKQRTEEKEEGWQTMKMYNLVNPLV